MDERKLRLSLSDLPLGSLRYFDKLGSTNDAAMSWASNGAPDLALVIAEEQTAGRGRGSRQWLTPPESALAFSLVLKPLPGEQPSIARFSALGALAVCEALNSGGFDPQIKWPNDVLLDRRKTCGILAESVWIGDKIESMVIGIGINVLARSVPPPAGLNFPATSLETEALRLNLQEMKHALDRSDLLHQILQALLYWRGLIGSDTFLHTWSSSLAFRGETVEIRGEGNESKRGILEGLDSDGSLRLRVGSDQIAKVRFGEVHLRPVV